MTVYPNIAVRQKMQAWQNFCEPRLTIKGEFAKFLFIQNNFVLTIYPSFIAFLCRSYCIKRHLYIQYEHSYMIMLSNFHFHHIFIFAQKCIIQISAHIQLLYKYILTLFLTLTLSCAPWARSRVAISTDPLETALCRGVSPCYYENMKCDENIQQVSYRQNTEVEIVL